MRIVIILLITITVSMAASDIVNADPLVGCTMIQTNSSKSTAFREMYVSSIGRFCETFGAGEIVNSALLDDQVMKFGCTDERCLLSLMRNAKINILITGSVTERNDNLYLNITARSSDNPFHGKVIHSRESSIPVSSKTSIRDIGYMAQEEAALFLAGLYDNYMSLLPIENIDGRPGIRQELSGRFDLYKVIGSGDDGEFTVKSGVVSIDSGVLITQIKEEDTYYIAKRYLKESGNIYKYILGRKKEIVCETRTFEHSLFAVPVVPFLSASSPISVPIGYYMNSDYQGLALSLASSAPWWYVSWKGLGGNILNLKNARAEIRRHDDGKYLFALYTAAFGSGGYVIDMMAHESLRKAGGYKERIPYICNDYTAISLSILVPGGGMFYRGSRLWGAVYYQIDNALAYMAISSIAKRNNKKAAYWLGAALTVKAIEVVHSYRMRDRIFASEMSATPVMLPIVALDENGSVRAGFAAASGW